MRNGKLIILGIIAIAGIVATLGGNEALAANGWEIPLNTTTTTTSQTNASVQLTMNGKKIQGTLDAANASTNPDEAGEVLTEVATIVVGSTDGYTVAVSGNANLTGEKNSNHKIPSVTSAKTLGSMKNEWGYYGVLGDSEASWNPSTSFRGMSTSQQTVATGGATTSNVTKKVTLFYGARVDNTIAEDFYGNTVTLSVVAQPRTVTNTMATFGGITQMQQMTPAICKAADINDTAQLEDVRDGKKYWVTKLLDGNCWMSQNLSLDLVYNVPLTSATGDVLDDWTGYSTSSDPLTGNTMLYNQTYSWNLGDYVIIDPTGATGTCNLNSQGFSRCLTQFTSIEGKTASSNPNFYKDNGNKTYTDTEYDAHYLVGNYYQWNAATAGTGESLGNDGSEANAIGSICPRGWKLPNSNATTNGTFTYLLQQYGTSNTVTGVSAIDNNTYNVTFSPLFLVKSGYIYPSNGYGLSSAGGSGYLRSSRSFWNNAAAYYLHFGKEVNTSGHSYRYYGYPLRCLVPTT